MIDFSFAGDRFHRFFSLLSFCLALQMHGMNSLENLNLIPADEREYLTSFFKGLLGNGSFALTLFGNKPAAPFDYPSKLIVLMDDGKLKREFLLQKRGWKIWNKYKDLFEFKNYLFLFTSDDCSSAWFVNKKAICLVLDSHRDFFSEYFSVDQWSENLENFLSEALIPNFSQNNFHVIKGLLLGYPWANCFDFQERSRIDDTLAFFPYDVEDVHFKSKAVPESLLDGYPVDLLKKYAHFENHFSFRKSWENTNPFFLTNPSGYLAFEPIHEPKFEEIKPKIMQLYNSDHFLEELLVILSK